jgi:hypothetical protein
MEDELATEEAMTDRSVFSFQFPLDLSAVALAKEDPGVSLSPLTSRFSGLLPAKRRYVHLSQKALMGLLG